MTHSSRINLCARQHPSLLVSACAIFQSKQAHEYLTRKAALNETNEHSDGDFERLY